MGGESRNDGILHMELQRASLIAGPRTLMPSSHIGIILVAIAKHHCLLTGVAM